MTREVVGNEKDEELERLLARWCPPVLPEGMDERMLLAYRRQVRSAQPWWVRLFTASVRVPLPVAVAVMMLVVVTAVLALRPASPPSTAGATGTGEPVQAAHVDRPVVTRTSLAGFQPVSEVTATVIADTQETRQ